ncbi:hypothetical protein NAI65_11845, partial [Francisella tularensis subsp. holarctica]|nr:hypothetical protein [Francisella tularensis subsp. holarctica]
QNKEGIERVAFEFVEYHDLDNVIYVEARFCPYVHRNQDLSYAEIIECISAGFARAKQKYDKEAGILVCGKYSRSDDINLE